MTEFFVGDVVKVEMPRGYSNRGVLGISLLYTTMPEARFDGATGAVTEINPVGPYSVHQYLIDFRTHDNSRAGLPWQAQWFREEWLSLIERVPASASPVAAPRMAQAGGGVATATRPAGTTATLPDGSITERGDGFLRVSGTTAAPDAYPIKGVDTTRRYLLISDDEYAQTPPDVVFADEATAQLFGYTREGSSTTDQVIDPAAAGAGGFSTGEDSELAVQDRPADAAGETGRTTFSPEGGDYFGSPAVDQPVRQHEGEARGDDKVGPTAMQEPATTSGRTDASAATAELGSRDGSGGDIARHREPTDAFAGSEDDANSGTSTGSVSGSSTIAPSSPIGATGATPPSPADTPPERSQPLSRSGTSLLDPSRLAAHEEIGSTTTSTDDGDELASEGDGGRSANQP